MRPIYENITAVGVGPAVPGGTGVVGAGVPHPVDARRNPVNISVGVVLQAGATATWVLEYTLDNVWLNTFNPATANWFPVSGGGGSANLLAFIQQPCTAIRCRLTAVTGLGVQLQLIQAGDGPG